MIKRIIVWLILFSGIALANPPGTYQPLLLNGLCSPVYVTGDRTASIATSTTVGIASGTISNLVDGVIAANSTDAVAFSAAGTSGLEIKFNFTTAILITEAKWYQDLTTSIGVWRWQGSQDGASWTNIGSSFTLGGSTTQTQTELNGNTTLFIYYRLLGVSGSTSSAEWNEEIQFKQCR